MLLHCNNYAFTKTPSYPPWGKIDYAFRLRFFLSFILAFLSFFLRFFLKGGLCIWPPPYRGIRGGLWVFLFFFLFIYIYLFI